MKCSDDESAEERLQKINKETNENNDISLSSDQSILRKMHFEA
jgi:hypothetical protein